MSFGFLCKLCLTYKKDRTGDGWAGLGWQSEYRCDLCTEDDELLVSTNEFVQRLRQEVKELRGEQNRMIRRFNEQAFMRKQKHCSRCVDLTQRLRHATEEWAKCSQEKHVAYERWARVVLFGQIASAMMPEDE